MAYSLPGRDGPSSGRDGDGDEQTDGVAMGSPYGPLMANVFMCHLEEKLACDGMVPSLYKRYVDDTLATMPNTLLPTF